jgi:hypothetical protein
MTPCHGFTGIVEQWKTSTHYATFIENVGTDEVESWTGPKACGNCHSLDGISYRVAGDVGHDGTVGPLKVSNGQHNYLSTVSGKINESTYKGSTSVAQVHCTTCHAVDNSTDPHKTGVDYTAGSFPLRVPNGEDDETIIEKSSAVGVSDGTNAGKFRNGNACIWCHKSRKDVTNYIVATQSITSTHWGPHDGPHSDVYSGKGGYHYAGLGYEVGTHATFTNGCIECHMPKVDSNSGIGDHSFRPQVSTCQQSGCHANAKDFDIGGGQSAMIEGIQQLRVALNNAGYLTRGETSPYAALSPEDLEDRDFKHDHARPGSPVAAADIAGALYNYFILGRGSAGGVHNPTYVRQLIFDSHKAVTGTPPATIPVRP